MLPAPACADLRSGRRHGQPPSGNSTRGHHLQGPHIFGPTDASCVFGYAYAQAEDNFWQIEDSWGASEVYGQKTQDDDLVIRTLEIPRLTKAEYKRSSPRVRELLDAFADGLNYFLERNWNPQGGYGKDDGHAGLQHVGHWAVEERHGACDAVHQPAPAVFRFRLSDDRAQRAPGLELYGEQAGCLRCLRGNLRQARQSACLPLCRWIYAGGYREAAAWSDTISVKTDQGIVRAPTRC